MGTIRVIYTVPALEAFEPHVSLATQIPGAAKEIAMPRFTTPGRKQARRDFDEFMKHEASTRRCAYPHKGNRGPFGPRNSREAGSSQIQGNGFSAS